MTGRRGVTTKPTIHSQPAARTSSLVAARNRRTLPLQWAEATVCPSGDMAISAGVCPSTSPRIALFCRVLISQVDIGPPSPPTNNMVPSAKKATAILGTSRTRGSDAASCKSQSWTPRNSKNLVKFCNGRGTAEQWIKEGKNAVNWTKLSCRMFKDNQTRLQLFALAYNLATSCDACSLPGGLRETTAKLRQRKSRTGSSKACQITHGRAISANWSSVHEMF